ncbi:1-acyl-sn-glycerol-3-phosphate acyltransferase [Dehalobacter restrictus DSM 9455]|uniref:1-acyl-sn-glycerol-3-phosphate acyltransferase n=2 Tax=Desulfitobacteriaceae TaxID=2937909 RepID=A0ABM5P6H6_DEHRP|nr:1-acyl-sn-glycerol-3-phosphate acyltransferase [Dehalobacter restrictus DSM 9455]
MMLYSLAKGIMTLVLKVKGCKITGLENFPAEGPVIIACNHISLWDPIIVGCSMPRQVYFMAKEELFSIPLLGQILHGLGTFPVKRGKGDIGAFRKSVRLLKEGKVLGIFPEGTRSKTGNIQEAMAGIVLIVNKSHAPILPVKVYGARGLLTQKRGKIGIIIGKPFYADNLEIPEKTENSREWLANKIMDVVNEM